MERKPLFFIRLLLPFCIGIWVLRSGEFAELNSVALIYSIIIIILLFIINYLYKSLKVYNHLKSLSLLIYFWLFLIGAAWCRIKNERQDFHHFSRNPAQFYKIFIADEPRQNGSAVRFNVRVIYAYSGAEKAAASGSLMVTTRSDLHDPTALKYGQTFIIPARYTEVPPPYNPGEFDFRSWLADHQIFHQAFLETEEMVPTGEQKGSALISFALALRQQQTGLYRKLIKDDEAFAVAAALILGYRSDLSAETLSAYTRTGTIHALSVSGMHVGIIYLVLEWGLRWMNRKLILKWIKVILLLTLIWSYTLLTGYSPSVLRSAIMLSLFIMAKSLRKDAGSLHVLTFSACCLLVYDPNLLWDAGFQLSYLAVLGLVWLQPGIERLLSFQWSWLQKLWSMVSLSIAAQVLTSPFSVYYFHQFPLYFIFSNLFIALPVALLMYGGIAILLFRLYWLAPAFEWLICFMNKGLSWIAKLPYAVIDAIWLSKTEFILLCLGLAGLLAGVQNRKKPITRGAVLLLLCLQLLLGLDKVNSKTQKKILLFSLSKNYAAAFINGRSAVVVTGLKAEDQAFRFHIRPALDQLKITTITCIKWGKEYHGGGLTIADHQLSFRNFRVLLIDSTMNRTRLLSSTYFDAIWLHLSPDLQIKSLRKDLRFHKIWIDGTNKTYAVNNYLLDTVNFGQTTIVLIKNNSSLINLK